MQRNPLGYFALTLHAHLPLVLGHGRWPHGSDWLSEVAINCYLPLLAFVNNEVAAHRSPHLTIDFSPVLSEQLLTPAFRTELEDFLRMRIQATREDRTEFSRDGREQLVALTHFWEKYYGDRLDQFERINGDLLAAFRRLQDEGHIELITCAATHGYLPLLSWDESIDLQLRVAVDTYTRHLGSPPAGIWLPECAYRPRYEWTPPVGPNKGKRRTRRRGIEEFLAERAIQFFFTDVHLVRGGRPLAIYRDVFPPLKAFAETEGPTYQREYPPYQPYNVASRGGHGSSITFVRDPESTLQVWSREGGYPGDAWYLEFHKKHFPGGHRYWRVTHPKSDLGDKEVYDPAQASARAQAHGDHFVELLTRVLTTAQEHTELPAIVCSPYDAELFGHWWFEGPQWIGAVYQRLANSAIQPINCRSYLERARPSQTVSLLEGSWGEGGDHRVWLNRETEWTWEMIYAAEDQFWPLARRCRGHGSALVRRVLAQLAREFLLLQASDWQFLITTWSARDYAEQRFAEHYGHFTHLARLLHGLLDSTSLEPSEHEFLAAREAQNFVFPNVLANVEAACELGVT